MSRVTLLAALTVLAAGAAIAGVDPAELRDGHGIHVAAIRQLDARQLDVQVSTAALQHPVDVRILLPDGYGDDPQRRYPVLYLFHGTSGRPSDWINFGNAEQTTAGLPLIVVLPDAGFDGDGGGWFTNWYNGGAGGQPMWETFHIDQIVPWIDANLRTISGREGRAIAGLSQGGFGSLSYAARHPDLFTSVAAFSGGCEIDRDPEAISIATGIIQYTASALDGVDPDAMFGPRATAELNWQAHDPATLVTNLRGMQIELWTGDGDRGPLDQGPPDPAASAIEVITFGATRLFHGHLEDARIPSTYHYYGAGTHTFRYWARDLEEYVGPLMRRFASSRAASDAGRLSLRRRPLAAVGLEGVGRTGHTRVQPSPSRTRGRLHPHRNRSRHRPHPERLSVRCARARDGDRQDRQIEHGPDGRSDGALRIPRAAQPRCDAGHDARRHPAAPASRRALSYVRNVVARRRRET